MPTDCAMQTIAKELSERQAVREQQAHPGSVGACLNYPVGTDPENKCGLYQCAGNGNCADNCSGLCGGSGIQCKTSAWCLDGHCTSDWPDATPCVEGCQCVNHTCSFNPLVMFGGPPMWCTF
jgi:hypothetical protein